MTDGALGARDESDDESDEAVGCRKDIDEALGRTESGGCGWEWGGEPIPLNRSRLSTASALDDTSDLTCTSDNREVTN